MKAGYFPKSVRIIGDKETGQSRGFGFVEVDEGQEAIAELDGVDLRGRRLNVREAEPEPAGRRREHATRRAQA